MRATEHHAAFLKSVADDVDAAVRASWRELMDRAFKAVEGVARAVEHDLERLVVIVPAGFADGHGDLACDVCVQAANFNPQGHLPVPPAASGAAHSLLESSS